MIDHVDQNSDPALILQHIWSELADAVEQGRHAFHTPGLATCDALEPSVRTVVLRHVSAEERIVACHTDIRSPKIAALRINPGVEWLFYDREQKIQLRLSGKAQLYHDDDVALARWQASRPHSRACYSQSPGPGENIPLTGMDEPDETAGFSNFVVLQSPVVRIDYLYLRAGGHVRLRFNWQTDQWQAVRIAP